MLFYKFEASAPKESEEFTTRRELNEFYSRIREKAEVFNDGIKGVYFFLSDITDAKISVGAIKAGSINPNEIITDFLKAVEIDTEIYKSEEITFKQLQYMLNGASRRSYISDDDEVLEKFRLDNLSPRYRGAIPFGENLIEKIEKKELYDRAKKYLVSETLIPEYDRIYAGKSKIKASGHPVHYMVITDSHNTRRAIYQNLLSALYANGRLESRRYCFINLENNSDMISPAYYENLYRSCIGGTMVIRAATGDCEEDDQATDERQKIELISRALKRFRNEVLTIICLPRECTKYRDLFNEYLASVCIVDLKEEVVDKDKAIDYLKLIAKRKKIRTDNMLFDRLEDSQMYLSNDLLEIFDAWYNNKLKVSVYPQYKECETIRATVAKQEAKGTGYSSLQEMVGLSNAKEVIKKALNFYKVQKLYRDQGINIQQPAMHMVFTGNPGTAKTSVARLFARIMKENELLSKGNLVEVGRGDLVGKYVGWTAKVVKEKFNAAMGGVLFIDEAYSLVDDRSGSFGDEAINTIVQEMENHRNELVVIFAGYPDKMEQFLNKNPGLRSRIAFHVSFNDYNTEELCEIARLMVNKTGTILTDGAIKKLSEVFEVARIRSDFGNGRYVRNVLDLARMNQATRLLELDADHITREEICTIREEDIESPNLGEAVAKHPIGFCA